MRLRLLLQVFILQCLLRLHGQNSVCSIGITVRRYTVYNSSSGESLTINCPVKLCNNSQPLISWIKRVEGRSVPVNMSNRVYTQWKTLKPLEGASLLIFPYVQMNDSGIYQCVMGSDLSHVITVNVSENVKLSNTTNENKPDSQESPDDELWLYVYISGGILCLVIFVIIITVLSLKFCKGISRKETQIENEMLMVPVVHQMRGSSPAPTARPSVRKKTPLSHPGKSNAVSMTQREEKGRVEYAALNHIQMPSATPRRPRPQQESTEYAAIRVHRDT